jgi:hypothetical protein
MATSYDYYTGVNSNGETTTSGSSSASSKNYESEYDYEKNNYDDYFAWQEREKTKTTTTTSPSNSQQYQYKFYYEYDQPHFSKTTTNGSFDSDAKKASYYGTYSNHNCNNTSTSNINNNYNNKSQQNGAYYFSGNRAQGQRRYKNEFKQMPKFEQSTDESNGGCGANSFIGNISSTSSSGGSSSSKSPNEEGDESISKDGSNPYKGFSKMKFDLASRFAKKKKSQIKSNANNYNVDGNTYYDYRETSKSYTSDEIQQLVDSLVDDPAWWSYFSNPPQHEKRSMVNNHLPTRPTDVSCTTSKASQPPPPHLNIKQNDHRVYEFDTKKLFKQNKSSSSGDEHSSSSLSAESGIFCSVNDLNSQTRKSSLSSSSINREKESKSNNEEKTILENKPEEKFGQKRQKIKSLKKKQQQKRSSSIGADHDNNSITRKNKLRSISNGIFDCDKSESPSLFSSSYSARMNSTTSLSNSSFLSSSSSSSSISSTMSKKSKSMSLKNVTNKLETDKLILLKTKNKIIRIVKKENTTAKSCSALNIQDKLESTSNLNGEKFAPKFCSTNELVQPNSQLEQVIDKLKTETTSQSCSLLNGQDTVEKKKINLSNLNLDNLQNDLESKISTSKNRSNIQVSSRTLLKREENKYKSTVDLNECKPVQSMSTSTKYYSLSDLVNGSTNCKNLIKPANEKKLSNAAEFFSSINSITRNIRSNKLSKRHSAYNLITSNQKESSVITNHNTSQKYASTLNLNVKNPSLKIVIEPGSDQEEVETSQHVPTKKTSKSFSSLDYDELPLTNTIQHKSTGVYSESIPDKTTLLLTSKSAYFQKPTKSELQNGSLKKRVVIKLVKKNESPPVPPRPPQIRQRFSFKKYSYQENNASLYKTENKIREKFQRNHVNTNKNSLKLATNLKKNYSNNLNETYKNCLCNYLKNLCIFSSLKKLDLLLKKRSNQALTSGGVHSNLSLYQFHIYFTFLNKKYLKDKRHEFYSEFRQFRSLNSLIRNFLRYIYLYKNLISHSQPKNDVQPKTCWPQMKTFSKANKTDRFRLIQQSEEKNSKKSNYDFAMSTPSEDLKLFMISFGFNLNHFSIILAIVLTIINKNVYKIEENSLLKNFLNTRRNYFKKAPSKIKIILFFADFNGRLLIEKVITNRRKKKESRRILIFNKHF